MKIGYARVSTQDQNLDLQLDALEDAGCKQIFKEKISSAKERPQLVKLLDTLREGDTLVVWKLDRLGRSLKDLLQMVSDFKSEGIGFVSLKDSIDTTTTHGRLIFNVFASLAEFERDMIRDRTRAGLTAARARGRLGGRRKGLSPQAVDKAGTAKALYVNEKRRTEDIASIIGVSRATVYRYLKYMKVNL